MPKILRSCGIERNGWYSTFDGGEREAWNLTRESNAGKHHVPKRLDLVDGAPIAIGTGEILVRGRFLTP